MEHEGKSSPEKTEFSPEDITILSDTVMDIFGVPYAGRDEKTIMALKRRFSKLNPRVVALEMRLVDLCPIIEMLIEKILDLTDKATSPGARGQAEVALEGGAALVMISALKYLPPKLRRRASRNATNILKEIDEALKKLEEKSE